MKGENIIEQQPEPLLHPLGIRARVLLTSVFGPYARDDEYGSRKILAMELYNNQITRLQGPFSYRMFHRSFQLLFLRENIDALCTVLDFPRLERFVDELKSQTYDIIGISAVPPNVFKVKKMCELIRQYQPSAVILVGGHVVGINNISEIVDADHFVEGDGVRWLRRYLGMDENAPIKHPAVASGFNIRVLGFQILKGRGDVAAFLIPSVGCPVGCEFCATSAMFGGKGKSILFYKTGDELFSVMCDLEKKLKVKDFFVQDENFLLDKKRTLRLLELMEQYNKSWTLFVFSSANALKSYTVDQLVRLGITWVWLGIEGKNSPYRKLEGIDTIALVRELQSHGIMFVASTMIGMEYHKPEDMDELIQWAVEHDADFHQFMLYHAIPGTPLYKKLDREGRLVSLEEMPWPDSHGMVRFNYRHPHFKEGEETAYLFKSFQMDFDVNGPSIARSIRTALKGWQKHKNHSDLRVRKRYKWVSRYLSTLRAASVWTMRKWYRKNETNKVVMGKLDALLQDLYREFGLISRITAPLLGRIVYIGLKREARRLETGRATDPPTFYEPAVSRTQ
jgi:hypothetical protein